MKHFWLKQAGSHFGILFAFRSVHLIKVETASFLLLNVSLCQTKNGDDMACSSMFLAYRAMTLKNVDFFLENQALFEDHDLKFNVEGDDSKARITDYLDSEKTKYRKLFNLVTHDDEGDEDFHLKNAVITIFFLYLLEQNFWFEEHSSDGWSEEKKIIAKIINHFICVAKVHT